MIGLLAASKTAIIVIGAIVGVIVLSVIMHFINREFRIRYDLNLFGGGLLMILAIGGIVVGFLSLSGKIDSKALGFAGFGLAALLIIITLVYDCKKCGGMGFVAFLCQLIFAPGALLLVFSFFSSKGSSYTESSWERRKIREERKRRGYDRDDRNDLGRF